MDKKRKISIALLAAAIFMALIYFALPSRDMSGMGGMNHGTGMNMSGTTSGNSTSP
jgi:hypothetical protein